MATKSHATAPRWGEAAKTIKNTMTLTASMTIHDQADGNKGPQPARTWRPYGAEIRVNMTATAMASAIQPPITVGESTASIHALSTGIPTNRGR